VTDLRQMLLTLADPPVAEPPAVADLERRQRRRRRKRVAVRVTPVMVCLLVLAGGIASVGGGDRAEPAAAPDVAVTVAPPTSPSTTAVADPSTCRNSYNASCGPFRWDPEPPEVPIEVEVAFEPAAPRVGEVVTFTVTKRRAAGIVRPATVDTGDGGSPRADVGLICPQPGEDTRYGAWDLPAPVPFEHTARYAWTYRSAGTYTARFTFEQWSCGRYGPVYPGWGTAAITVTVQR